MKRLVTILLAGLWLGIAGRAQALELGDIEVGSLRGEPLMARIALDDLPTGESGELTVRLGGPEDFVRSRLERHDYLRSLEFEIVTEGPEPAHVMIRGRDPIDASFTTFLVEALWSEGREIREYTVLLDAAPPETSASYGPVRATDTLWSLAGRYRPQGVSVQRMMLAILAQNPHAFAVANVNALREGAILEIPARTGPDEKADAIQEVERQNDSWRIILESGGPEVAAAGMPAPEAADAEMVTPSPEPATEAAQASPEALGETQDTELRVVVPGTGESAESDREQQLRAELDVALGESDSTRQEVVELSARLDEAELLVADLQRLVELKDDDIAGLQRRLEEQTEAAEQARAEAAAQARAATAAQAEALAQSEAAAQAQAELKAQASATEQAREEARIQADIARAAQSDALALSEALTQAEAAAAAPAEIGDATVAAAVPEPLPDLGLGQEQEFGLDEGEGAEAAAEAVTAGELAPALPEAGESDESMATPSLLGSLEDTLGFSPVVGGVGLVGVILILGGLIALMRRRSSNRDELDEEDVPSEEDTEADFWGDEVDLEGEGPVPGPDDEVIPPAEPAREEDQRAAVEVPDIEDFDIGIDLEEDLTRALEEQLESDSDLDSDALALERALSPDGERVAGPAPPRSPLGPRSDAGPDRIPGTGDEDLAAGLGGPRLADFGDEEPRPEGERQRTSARRLGDTEPLEGVAGMSAGEDLASDVDELQTKLDLAQTYIEMEDFENARPLLREVQSEGGLEQRAIARYLSGKLP